MLAATTLHRGSIAVIDHCCDAGPTDTPFLEQHTAFSLSYVRRGSFGYRHRGKIHELVSGSVLIGYPGDEYMCTHEHVGGGDECLSFYFTPESIEELQCPREYWQLGYVPPLAELMVLGELAQAATAANNNLGLDEIGLWIAARFTALASDRSRRITKVPFQDRRRAVQAAAYLDAFN